MAPLLRASESPIAIACLRLLTFLPERPLRSVPAFYFFIARLTFLAAPFEYFRFFAFFAISLAPAFVDRLAMRTGLELVMQPKVQFAWKSSVN